MNWALPLMAAMAVALGACQETRGGVFGFAFGSPAGVPIAFDTIEGAPAPVRTALARELAAAAARRQVQLVGWSNQARYRVRGYLTTEPSPDGGTALAFVWDVFDPHSGRAKRVTGSSPIRSASRDPWTGLDKAALARLADESMHEIASFLSASAAAGMTPTPTPASPTRG
jgi:hypothetical protein